MLNEKLLFRTISFIWTGTGIKNFRSPAFLMQCHTLGMIYNNLGLDWGQLSLFGRQIGLRLDKLEGFTWGIWRICNLEIQNKNKLTRQVNCKKTTKFWQFRGQISPNSKLSKNNVSFKLKVIFSANFRPKTKKVV